MRITILSFAILLASFGSAAQNLPEKPEPKFNKAVFAIGVSLLGASTTADNITTRQLLDRGGWENNPTLGYHPSLPRQIGVGTAIFAGQVAAFDFTEHNRHAWVRWTGRAYLALVIANHVRFAVCNSKINTKAPIAHSCSGPYF